MDGKGKLHTKAFTRIAKTVRSTNLLWICAFTAACVALQDVKFHVQNGLAVTQVSALAVKSGESALNIIQQVFSVGFQMEC
jgi:hypothetical protein